MGGGGAVAPPPGPAATLGPTALVYELAYGGVDDTALSTARRDGAAKGYLRRPAGRIVR